jgi:hypothetical protein
MITLFPYAVAVAACFGFVAGIISGVKSAMRRANR